MPVIVWPFMLRIAALILLDRLAPADVQSTEDL